MKTTQIKKKYSKSHDNDATSIKRISSDAKKVDAKK
jgi:hypothetical protein